MAATKTVLLRKQLFDVGDMIRAHCKVDDETGYAVYEEGWDDARIMQSFLAQFPITLANVVRIRRDLLGDLMKARKSDMQEEIALLRRRIFLLEQWAMKRKHDAFKPEIVMPKT